MAFSLSSFCSLNQVSCRHNKLFHCPKMKNQSFRDNGKSENIVDANLNVLRERIQGLKKRERLISTCGWNYEHHYDNKFKREAIISECTETIGLACGAIGLVFLVGCLCIFFVSLLVHYRGNYV